MSQVSELRPLVNQAKQQEANRVKEEVKKLAEGQDSREHDLKRAKRHLNASNQSVNKIGHGLDKPYHQQSPDVHAKTKTVKINEQTTADKQLEYIDK